jgi:DNA-3-methyladenine glycosylase
MKKLSRDFYARDTTKVAKDLLGKYLVHVTDGVERIGRIVEVEAYTGIKDLASHSSKGLTKRTRVMFGPAGYAYVYLIYGMHYCMNIVTEAEGNGCAVLIRAIEPVSNIEGRTQGPGLLCKAMHINKTLDEHDLLSDNFYVADIGDKQKVTIIKRPRIGVPYAGDWASKLLRFYIKDNKFVSKA